MDSLIGTMMKSLQRGLALFFLGLFVFSVLLLNSVYLYVLLTCLGRQISLMGDVWQFVEVCVGSDQRT